MKIIKKPANTAFHADEPMLAELVPDDGLLLDHLAINLKATKAFILSLPESKLRYKYAEGKWTIKEVLVHLTDMERIYMYRALRLARNDQTVLPGFDHNSYILFSGANDRHIAGLVEELASVRYATITLIKGLTAEALERSGVINGERVSVCALLYHIAGHELHHLNVIKERYLW